MFFRFVKAQKWLALQSIDCKKEFLNSQKVLKPFMYCQYIDAFH